MARFGIGGTECDIDLTTERAKGFHLAFRRLMLRLRRHRQADRSGAGHSLGCRGASTRSRTGNPE